MILSFSKYAGCGNDFILIDNRIQNYPLKLTPHLCHRQNGIGADGVILLENSPKADFRMRIFNADGSEAEMCGNGIRCLARFIHEKIEPKTSWLIETMHALIPVQMAEHAVTVAMPNPRNPIFNLSLPVKEKNLLAHYLDTGVPHCILFVNDLESDVDMQIAPLIRHHPKFAPKGANVNFVAITPQQTLKIRTYERGVEGETLACGTGAVAAALTAAQVYDLPSPITVKTRSQELLTIYFKKENNSYMGIKMEGPALKIFDGKLDSLAFGKDLI